MTSLTLTEGESSLCRGLARIFLRACVVEMIAFELYCACM